jgi:hypothetical protein
MFAHMAKIAKVKAIPPDSPLELSHTDTPSRPTAKSVASVNST